MGHGYSKPLRKLIEGEEDKKKKKVCGGALLCYSEGRGMPGEDGAGSLMYVSV